MEPGEILRTLCTGCGVSGNEEEMYSTIKQLLEGYSKDVIQMSCGTIVAEIGENDAPKHIMLDAHIDRIGLIITDINDNGFLKAEPVGGMDLRALAGTVVNVRGREELTGVICTKPPHLSRDDENLSKDELWIDTGLASEKVKKLVTYGDFAVVRSSYRELLNRRIAAPALDNRCGCAVLIRCAQIIRDKLKNIRVSLVFSSQEEFNESGAAAAAFELEPDEAIVVDAGFAAQDGIPSSKSGNQGKGIIITIAPVLSRSMTKQLIAIAAATGKGYDFEVDGGNTGTNADKISTTRGGIPCALISVPVKNMHTQAETVCLDDIEAAANVIASYIIGGNGNV